MLDGNPQSSGCLFQILPLSKNTVATYHTLARYIATVYSYSGGKIRAEKKSAAFPSALADIDDIQSGRNHSCTTKIIPALSAKLFLHY